MLTATSSLPIPLARLTLLEFAITFVNLVIPSTAARIATKMRYFQKSGMTITSATAMSGIDAFAGFLVQITVLLSALLFGLGGIEFDVDSVIEALRIADVGLEVNGALERLRDPDGRRARQPRAHRPGRQRRGPCCRQWRAQRAR